METQLPFGTVLLHLALCALNLCRAQWNLKTDISWGMGCLEFVQGTMKSQDLRNFGAKSTAQCQKTVSVTGHGSSNRIMSGINGKETFQIITFKKKKQEQLGKCANCLFSYKVWAIETPGQNDSLFSHWAKWHVVKLIHEQRLYDCSLRFVNIVILFSLSMPNLVQGNWEKTDFSQFLGLLNQNKTWTDIFCKLKKKYT